MSLTIHLREEQKKVTFAVGQKGRMKMSVLIKGMEMPEHCGYCRFRYDGICHALQKTQYSVTECPLVSIPAQPERNTNADRIRAMSDEELAMILQPTCPSGVCRDDPPHDCYKCWLGWLKQEVKE